MIDLLTDGYTWGLTAAWWTLAALLGALTVIGPATLSGWLLSRTARQLSTSRPAWWLRTQPAHRRARQAHKNTTPRHSPTGTYGDYWPL